MKLLILSLVFLSSSLNKKKYRLTILKCHFCIPKEPFYDPKEPLYKSQLMLRKRLIGLNCFILQLFLAHGDSSPQGFD